MADDDNNDDVVVIHNNNETSIAITSLSRGEMGGVCVQRETAVILEKSCPFG